MDFFRVKHVRIPIPDPRKKDINEFYKHKDLEELLGFIAAEANHTEDRDLEEALDSLHDKLEDILDVYEESE